MFTLSSKVLAGVLNTEALAAKTIIIILFPSLRVTPECDHITFLDVAVTILFATAPAVASTILLKLGQIVSVSLKPSLEWQLSGLFESDHTAIIISVTVTDTAKTKSTLAKFRRYGERPIAEGWTESEHKLKVLDEDSDFTVHILNVVVLLISMVWLLDEVNLCVGSVSSILEVEHSILGDHSLEFSYVILDDKVLDLWSSLDIIGLVKQVDKDLVLVVTSIIGESVVALGLLGKLKVVPVKCLEGWQVELGTSASTLADVGWAAALVGTREDWSLTTWAHEHTDAALVLWTVIHDFIGEALASSTTVTLMVKLGADWVDKTIVSTTTFDVLVGITAVVTILTVDDKLLPVQAFTEISWNDTCLPVADTSWSWTTFRSSDISVADLVVFFLDVASWADKSNNLWTLVKLTFASTASLGIYVDRVATAAFADLWLAFINSNIGTVYGELACASITSLNPVGTALEDVIVKWVFTFTICNWNALSTASIVVLDLGIAFWADQGVVLVKGVLDVAWIPVTLFQTVEALASRTLTLPLIIRLLDTLRSVAWALAWMDKLLAVANETFESNKLDQINGEGGTLTSIGNIWADWNVALADALVTLVATFWGFLAVTVTNDSAWATETTWATIDRFLGTWDTLFWVADADKVWAYAVVLVDSVDSDDLFVSLAAWRLDLSADIEALVYNTGVSQAAFVTQVGKHSLFWLTSWLWLAKHRSVITSDETVLETRTEMASITVVVPGLGKCSGTSLFVDALWWWGWSNNDG